MIVSFLACLFIGLLGVGVGLLGIRRAKTIAIPPLDVTRRDNPALFWFGVTFQIAIGAMCLLAAFDLLVPFGFGDLLSKLVE